MVAGRKAYSQARFESNVQPPFWWDALRELPRENVSVPLNHVTQFFPVTYRNTFGNLLFSFSNKHNILLWVFSFIY